MKVNKVHCLFEQSGTFKNEFIKLGIAAEDYDILNNFGQTDNVCDLFSEIDKAYNEEESIFDQIKKEDLIFAFFPCTRFSQGIFLELRTDGFQFNNYSEIERLYYSKQKFEEVSTMFELFYKFCIILKQKNIRTIIENPYTQPQFLTMCFPLKPKIIIKDRNLEGDYYKKPTQFFFLNCEPESNVIFEPIPQTQLKNIEWAKKQDGISRQEIRSMISPVFANRFIRQYIITQEGNLFV